MQLKITVKKLIYISNYLPDDLHVLCIVDTAIDCSQFCHQVTFICAGLTSHEFYKNLSIKNMQSLPSRLRSVFGPFWLVNVCFPAFCF